jgi:ATP-dependent HslUV protease subunit HslV
VSGTGELLEPDLPAGASAKAGDGVLAIGSGGPYALAAARALMAHTDLSAEQIVREALSIAADICIYSNRNLTVEVV